MDSVGKKPGSSWMKRNILIIIRKGTRNDPAIFMRYKGWSSFQVIKCSRLIKRDVWVISKSCDGDHLQASGRGIGVEETRINI